MKIYIFINFYTICACKMPKFITLNMRMNRKCLFYTRTTESIAIGHGTQICFG